MTTTTIIEHNLPEFLRELANDIESGNISDQQMKTIGEFFMRYHFEHRVLHVEQATHDFVSGDIKKFITLGWYVYTQLLKDESLTAETSRHRANSPPPHQL